MILKGSNEQYNQLYFWCEDNKREICAFFNPKEALYKELMRGPITIGTFPSEVDEYLTKYCSLYRQLSKAIVEIGD